MNTHDPRRPNDWLRTAPPGCGPSNVPRGPDHALGPRIAQRKHSVHSVAEEPATSSRLSPDNTHTVYCSDAAWPTEPTLFHRCGCTGSRSPSTRGYWRHSALWTLPAIASAT